MALTKRELMIQMKYDTAKRNIDFLYDLAQLTDLTSEQQKEFVVRYMDLEKYYEELVTLHYEIQLKAEDTELDDHIQSYDSYNKKYYVIKRKHFELFNSSPKLENVDANKQAGSRAVLPRLQIPTFSGKIEEYLSFMELFQSLVGSDSTLSNTEKMYYLTGSLVGEPKSLIQHLSITGDNYSVAIDLLNSRYNNKRLLADRLLRNLLSVANVGSKNLSGLKLFLNTLSESTKALEKMNFPVDSWSYLLFYINFQKLDSNMRKHFEDKVADKDLPTFADLIKFLETEIRILESSAEPLSFASEKRGGGPSHAVKAHAVFNNAGFSCKLCAKGGHFIAKCDKFLAMTPAARKRHVIAHNLCFRCLNGHNIDRCNYNGNCYKCNSSKHHYLLHFDLPASASDRQHRPATSNGCISRPAPDSAPASVPSTSAPSASSSPVNAVPGTTGLMASHVNKDHCGYQRTVLLARCSMGVARVLLYRKLVRVG
jgi:hypothetical protein